MERAFAEGQNSMPGAFEVFEASGKEEEVKQLEEASLEAIQEG